MPSEKYATTYHAPVLVEEVLQWLEISSGGVYLDGTAGGGGHTQAILEASSPDGRVLALDRDPRAVEEVRRRLGGVFAERLTVVEANYSEAPRVMAELGWGPVDGWLIDAGVSSHQFDEPERGFSFQNEGPLDMRMGPQAPTVAEFLDEVDEEELARIFREYGEMSGSWRLAKAILEARCQGRLETTRDLSELIVDRSPPRHHPKAKSIHPATLVFQALRIAVNQELEHLKSAVAAVPLVVAEGGRAAFISFHSLEDRIVKHGFRELANPCTCPADFPICGCGAVSAGEVLTRRPVTASDEECAANPRARSAKLRAFQVSKSIEQVEPDRRN